MEHHFICHGPALWACPGPLCLLCHHCTHGLSCECHSDIRTMLEVGEGWQLWRWCWRKGSEPSVPVEGKNGNQNETMLPKRSVRQGEHQLLSHISQRTLWCPDGVRLCFETVWAASLAHLSDRDSSWCRNKKHSSWCSCALKTSPFLKMNLDKFPDYTSGSLIYSSKDQNGG